MLHRFGTVKPAATPRVVAVIAALSGLVGCIAESGGGAPVDAGSDVTQPAPDGPAPDSAPGHCDPPLMLLPTAPKVLPLGLLPLRASGGTGSYAFELATDASGAVLNEVSGAYLAGTQGGVTDVVAVTDLGCEGRSETHIDVVAPMVVRPLRVELRPLASFTYEITGGSGSFACTLDVDGSGASVTPTCGYTAGADPGTDVVKITDTETGQRVDSTVTVTPSATLVPAPARIHLPLSNSYRLAILGGSGTFDATITGSAVSYDDGAVTGEQPGFATLDLTDHFTGQTTQVVAEVIVPREADLLRAGDILVWGQAHSPGDLDGDGYADAVLGWPEADVLAYDGGAAFVYRGGPTGLDPEPAAIYAGATWAEEAGRAVQSGDFDGDGRFDLAVGAPSADVGHTDNGQVRIHLGREGDVPDAAPATSLRGPFDYDYFGYSLAACDFNADGHTDLAVGARYAEDRDQPTPANDQGAVFVFLGSEDGLATEPQVERYGQAPDGAGGWMDATNMRLGIALAAGDLDGDGACDLAASSFEYETSPGRGQDGAVLLYRGVPAGPSAPGGLSDVPMLAWAGGTAGQAGSAFGFPMEMGDLDGDGKDDLAVGQYRQNATPGIDERQGAVRVFRGRALGTPAAAFEMPENADWTYVADGPYDQIGYEVTIADANGDGRKDLLVGGLTDESGSGVFDAGALLFFPGVDGDWPAPMPAVVLDGLAPYDYFAQTLAVLPDADGDDVPDVLVVSSLEDGLGLNVGRPYFVSGAAPATYTPLDVPGASSGQQVGRAVAVLGDLNGDGFSDLAVGAPDAETAQWLTSQGVVHVYLGGASGFDTAPALTLANFTGHGGYDQFGWDVIDAGDFDGDGLSDLAVLARFGDRPDSFGAAYANPTDCPGLLYDTAAVYVFRGVAAGLPSPEPSFVYYGPQPGRFADQIAGKFDANGDGRDDLLLGGPYWYRPGVEGSGGFTLVLGRSAAPSRITVICAADYTWLGLGVYDQAGYGLAGVGDLDGDGCDEFAVGTWLEDVSTVNDGTVRLFHGWGGPGCPAGAEATTLGSPDPYGGAGFSLGGGGDVDGDGLGDLALGAPYAIAGNDSVGAAWVLLGSYLASLPTEPVVIGTPPATVWPFSSGPANQRLAGNDVQEFFGNAVALVPGYEADGRAALAVGTTLGSVNGFARTGGVRVHSYNVDGATLPLGFSAIPTETVGAESDPTDSRVGESLAAGTLAGTPVLVLGGTRADGIELDRGAAYVAKLSAP